VQEALDLGRRVVLPRALVQGEGLAAGRLLLLRGVDLMNSLRP
jgi:hypothetical protein